VQPWSTAAFVEAAFLESWGTPSELYAAAFVLLVWNRRFPVSVELDALSRWEEGQTGVESLSCWGQISGPSALRDGLEFFFAAESHLKVPRLSGVGSPPFRKVGREDWSR